MCEVEEQTARVEVQGKKSDTCGTRRNADYVRESFGFVPSASSEPLRHPSF